MSLLSRTYMKSVIVFINTKRQAHRVAILLALNGMNFAELHGHMSQTQRVENLSKFQNGEAPFLLATDVAARGLDLPIVETVINFNIPMDTARYIHRVGRTARMGNNGSSVTLYTEAEYKAVKALAKACTDESK